jgi:hypothetical protein
MHFGIYRRNPFTRFPALRNAWRAAQLSLETYDPGKSLFLVFDPFGRNDVRNDRITDP